MFSKEKQIIESNSDLSEHEKGFQVAALDGTSRAFEELLDKNDPQRFESAGHFRMNQRAVLAALFINLYRDEPILFLPFRLLTNLVEIDELWTTWRQRHAIMVQRMLGTRIGTRRFVWSRLFEEDDRTKSHFFPIFLICPVI